MFKKLATILWIQNARQQNNQKSKRQNQNQSCDQMLLKTKR